MILFKSVKYKNILSTGDSWTTVLLNDKKSTLIVGDNGAGKSTMLDAICFALYGKPFRKINKPQLINSINKKDLQVELSFQIGAKDYLVKRGIKPTLFEIWCNGELLNQDAAARDYQAYLEENILKLNFKSFGQIVVLGSSTFVPFMQLPAASRREVIEDLLDIQIFTIMNTLLKEKVASNKEAISESKYSMDLLENQIKSAEKHNESIRQLRETEVVKLKGKLKEQIALIEGEQQEINTLVEEIEVLRSSIEDKPKQRKNRDSLQKVSNDLTTKHTKLIKDIHFYENHDNCPTCRQGIEHDFKEETVTSANTKIEEIKAAQKELADKLEGVHNRLLEIEAVEDNISAKNLKQSEHNANYKMAMNICKSIKDELQKAEQKVEEIDSVEIDDLKSKLVDAHNSQQTAFENKEMLAVVASMLKDGGIKTQIIKQYIPVMNKLINKYLAAMDFFVQFELDENFNETIKSRFRDVFSYASFSEGEKLRIDLALLFTWRAVSKLRNSTSTNLLIMDEIMDSSLDNAGTEEFLKIINELTADSNIFIISHKGDQLFDKFDNVIKFEKVKNFSRRAA